MNGNKTKRDNEAGRNNKQEGVKKRQWMKKERMNDRRRNGG